MPQNFRAYLLAIEIYKQCKTLRIPDHLYQQLVRASSSVVLNLAEGSGKRTAADQRRFYAMARGSLRECFGILAMESPGNEKLASELDHLGAMIHKLISSCTTADLNEKR